MQRPGPMAKTTFSLVGIFKWHQAPSGSSALILLLTKGKQHSTELCNLFCEEENGTDFRESLRLSGRFHLGMHNYTLVTIVHELLGQEPHVCINH